MNHGSSVTTATRPRPRTLSRHDREWIYANCCARLEAHGVNPRRAKTVTAVYEYLERLSAVFPDNTDADDPMVNPSVERIAEETRSSLRGVKHALARLGDLGLVRTVRRTGRAAWRALTNSIGRMLAKRGANNTRREVQTSTRAGQPPYISLYDQKNDQRAGSAPAERRGWASSTPTTPTPPRFVPTPATGSSPELRAKLRTGWRNLAKRGDRF
ncbi:hypothetical protein JOE26_001241 [Rhodococcus coprophilus]|uniref:Uncharacterized protein n=1 Tax=Rhodococcus coprophilus TaxID=38310 RepID=A0A2X4U155_9NOCA|nr:hypothetical protein [Rhodococcus coprophilus]SQI32881.1 Uncharacterised protein [Rhodococcus coprophilus]